MTPSGKTRSRPARPRRSPLRVATGAGPAGTRETGTGRVAADLGAGNLRVPARPPSARQLRQLMVSEFCSWLRSRTNSHGRPFHEDTIIAYRRAARALDAWMAAQDLEADFTGCDTAMLNRFFATYLAAHGQGGTNTLQRNLRHLFTWLETEYDHPHPYGAGLQRYAPAKTRPSTLAEQFIADLLEVTGGGRARGFDDARDHALIRFLTEGVRRTEVMQLHTEDLPPDLMTRPVVRVVPLKGARAAVTGRLVPLSHPTARATIAYLRARRYHQNADSPWLWLGSGSRGPLTGAGLYRMLKRRAEQAGYDPAVHPHQFRHTFANDWLQNGGAEGDLMRLMGWTSRSMLDRYGEDMAVQRAIGAKRRMGDLY